MVHARIQEFLKTPYAGLIAVMLIWFGVAEFAIVFWHDWPREVEPGPPRPIPTLGLYITGFLMLLFAPLLPFYAFTGSTSIGAVIICKYWSCIAAFYPDSDGYHSVHHYCSAVPLDSRKYGLITNLVIATLCFFNGTSMLTAWLFARKVKTKAG